MTRIDLGLVANDVIYLVTGYAFLFAAGLARLRLRDVRLVGLSYLAGWALMGTAVSLVLMAGIELRPATVVIVAVLAIVACVVLGLRRPNELPATAVGPWSAPGMAAVVIGGAVIAIAAAAAVVTAVSSVWVAEFDLLSAWLPRAEIVYYLHQLDPTEWSSFIDPWYPPLAPVMFGTTFEFVGGFHPSVLPFQQTLLGLAFVLAALVLLDRFVPRWISFPSLALLMVTPWFWWRLQSLLPDQTLAYMLAAAAIVTVIWLYEPNGAWLALGVVFLSAATLVKLEGFVFAALLVLVALVAAAVLHRRRALPALWLLLGPAVMIPWRLWLDTHHVMATNPDFNQPHLLDPGFLAGRIGAFGHAIRLILGVPWGHSFKATEAMIVLGAVVFLCVVRRIPVIAVAAVTWIGLMILALAATYATSRVDLGPYFSFTAPRVGGTFVVAAATLTPLLLGLALRAPARSPGRPQSQALDGADASEPVRPPG